MNPKPVLRKGSEPTLNSGSNATHQKLLQASLVELVHCNKMPNEIKHVFGTKHKSEETVETYNKTVGPIIFINPQNTQNTYTPKNHYNCILYFQMSCFRNRNLSEAYRASFGNFISHNFLFTLLTNILRIGPTDFKCFYIYKYIYIYMSGSISKSIQSGRC